MIVFKVGFIINPWSGIGGAVGLKGSDGEDIRQRAIALGARQKSSERCRVALESLREYVERLQFFCFDGAMGADLLEELGFQYHLLGRADSEPSSAQDTERAARAILEEGVDLILFAGGDGTARNLCSVVAENVPVLGIPAGVKIQSGVYAVSPSAAGTVMQRLLDGQLVNVELAEVRDIDEAAYRDGSIKSRHFGDMLVPSAGGFVQSVKFGGREVEALVLDDIAAHLQEQLLDDELILIGAGTTTRAISEALGVEHTLLGVDAVCDGERIGADLNESQILDILHTHRQQSSSPVKLLISVIGGQGHVLGRGNQQLSPAVIRAVGRDNIIVIASKTKITELQGRPLLVDSGDADLDREWRGLQRVVTGYQDEILYPISDSPEE